jgi:hypothetical protein
MIRRPTQRRVFAQAIVQISPGLPGRAGEGGQIDKAYGDAIMRISARQRRCSPAAQPYMYAAAASVAGRFRFRGAGIMVDRILSLGPAARAFIVTITIVLACVAGLTRVAPLPDAIASGANGAAAQMQGSALNTAWQIQTVDSSGNRINHQAIALDSAGRPHIAYADETTGALMYTRWTGTQWDIPQVVKAKGTVPLGNWVTMALDSADKPHLSYTGGALWYSRWTGTGWDTQAVDTQGGGDIFTACASLALDSSDRPHIAYYYTQHGLRYVHWTGSSWSKQAVDGQANAGYYCSLALDGNDRAHIGYYVSSTPTGPGQAGPLKR